MSEPIVPKDKAFLDIKLVQECMDAHAKRICIAYGEWVDQNAVRNGFHDWTIGYGAPKQSYTSEQLYNKFIESITK